MNILLITQIYPEPDDKTGYMPTHTVEYFAREWSELGHNVVVIHCQTKFPYPYYLVPNKITNLVFRNTYAIIPSISSRKKIHRKQGKVDVFRSPMMKYIPSTAFSEREMNRQVEEIRKICKKKSFVPDIVAGHFVNPCLELTSMLGKIFNAKTSFVFHNDCSTNSVKKYRLEKYIKDIDVFGGRSIIEAKHIKNTLKLQYMPFVCYSGVPNESVKNVKRKCTKHLNGDEINFLYVGGLVLKKNVDSIIKAFSRVYKDGYRLTIIGGGPEEDNLRKLAVECGISDSVRFTGRLSRDEVSLEMSKANIFTMISTNETFGMVYLEAMLQGCVVIASIGGGFDGIINTQVNGFLCKAGDDEQLTSLYSQIIKMSREEWNRIGTKAINTAINFSEREVAKHYINEIIEN